jgi:hypothetical protein
MLVILNVFQGLVVRFFGPPLLVVWLFRFGLFVPEFFHDPAVIFSPEVSLTALEIDMGRLKYGLVLGGPYLLLYIVYILGHIPHAKPITKGIQITRYTEPTAYTGDKQSAYREWIFTPVLWANFFVMFLFIVNVTGMLITQGWFGTSLMIRVLICICFAPFGMGILEGLMHCDFRCLVGMIYSAPVAMTLMIWFTVWLPAYATTRLSDLTWGNRERVSSLDESEKALNRKCRSLLCSLSWTSWLTICETFCRNTRSSQWSEGGNSPLLVDCSNFNLHNHHDAIFDNAFPIYVMRRIDPVFYLRLFFL